MREGDISANLSLGMICADAAYATTIMPSLMLVEFKWMERK